MLIKKLIYCFILFASLSSTAQNRVYTYSQIQTRNDDQEWIVTENVCGRCRRATRVAAAHRAHRGAERANARALRRRGDRRQRHGIRIACDATAAVPAAAEDPMMIECISTAKTKGISLILMTQKQ